MLVNKSWIHRIKIAGIVLLALPAFAVQVDTTAVTAGQAVDFDHIQKPKTSIAIKMVAFEMPAEYECPLFSNSPYTEILSSLDKMQANLNRAFPGCDNQKTNEQLSQKAVTLRNSVFEAKKQSDSGQTFKLSMTADAMVEAAKQVQEALVVASEAQTKVCYDHRSDQQFRSMVFSINETFQGIAPVVLDMLAKNPALAAQLGPAVKILAGADSLSKGLGLVEQIAKDSVMFDMTDTENRVNTLKNVCQYMKLYRRLEYLRLSKLGKTQTIFSEYQSKISDINNNLSTLKEKSGITTQDTAMSYGITEQSSDPVYEVFKSLKTILPDELNKLQKTKYEIELAEKQYKIPEISQCEIVQYAKASISFKKTADKLLDFVTQLSDSGMDYGQFDSLQSLHSQLQAYDGYFQKAKDSKDLKTCVNLGKDWIELSLNLLSEGQKTIHLYEKDLSELNGNNKAKDQRIAKKERDLKNAQSNLESLKSLLNYASFESSEIEKRAKDMQRYFFKGPKSSEIKSDCADPQSKCSWGESLIGLFKAKYQVYRNDGPIFELLLNNELHFNYAFDQMTKALSYIAKYESSFAEKEFKKNNSLKESKEYINAQKYINSQKLYMSTLPHLTTDFLKAGSIQHQNICMQIRQVVDKYLIASTHMLSSQSLCDMIYPALKEQVVAPNLKKYCIAHTKTWLVAEGPSGVQTLIYKLVSHGTNATLPLRGTPGDSVYAPVSADYLAQTAPKEMVDKLTVKYDNLHCEEKSGF